MLTGDFQDVDEPVHLYVPCLEGELLRGGGEKGCKIVYGVDVVSCDSVGNLGPVNDVHHGRRAALQELTLGLETRNIACYDISFRMQVPEFHGQLRTNLTGRTDYKNIFH